MSAACDFFRSFQIFFFIPYFHGISALKVNPASFLYSRMIELNLLTLYKKKETWAHLRKQASYTEKKGEKKISLHKNYFSISALITPRLSNWCWLSYYRCLKIFSLSCCLLPPSSSTSFPSYWPFIFILLTEFLVDFYFFYLSRLYTAVYCVPVMAAKSFVW